jgi:hypothetical protein
MTKRNLLLVIVLDQQPETRQRVGVSRDFSCKAGSNDFYSFFKVCFSSLKS